MIKILSTVIGFQGLMIIYLVQLNGGFSQNTYVTMTFVGILSIVVGVAHPVEYLLTKWRAKRVAVLQREVNDHLRSPAT